MTALHDELIEKKLEPAGASTFVPVAADELAAIERKLGVELPASYRDFLARFGSSRFHGISTIEPEEPLPQGVSKRAFVNDFYGSAQSGNMRSVAHRIQMMVGRMPRELIPIAGAGMGDQLCLGIAGTYTGRVYYWYHEDEPLGPEEYAEEYGTPMPDKEWFRNVSLVANSFDDLIRRMVVSVE